MSCTNWLQSGPSRRRIWATEELSSGPVALAPCRTSRPPHTRPGSAVQEAIPLEESQILHERSFEATLEVRDASARELLVRVVPWGVVANSKAGPEVWEPGSFDGVDPTSLVLQLEHMDPPAGRSRELENRSDGEYALFKVSKTQRGDDILALAADGVTRGVSVSFMDIPGGTEIQTRNGRRTRVVRKADVRAVSTTWRPTWEQSAVLEIRSEPEQEITPMPEQEAPVPRPHRPPARRPLAADGTVDGHADRLLRSLRGARGAQPSDHRAR